MPSGQQKYNFDKEYLNDRPEPEVALPNNLSSFVGPVILSLSASRSAGK